MADLKPEDLVKLIKEECTSFVSGGTKFFIVERDIAVAEPDLEAYADSVVAAQQAAASGASDLELVAATIGGRPMRWALGTRLTWMIRPETFPRPEDAEWIRDLMRTATGDWNEVAEERQVDIAFAETDTAEAAVFEVSFERFSDARVFAVAFFPSDPPDNRVIRVGSPMLRRNSMIDPAGVLRHELGHVLGFRHEHIRTGAPGNTEALVVGDLGSFFLTPPDIRSVMHYPMGDFGTLEFKLTILDRDGLQRLYHWPEDEVREFKP